MKVLKKGGGIRWETLRDAINWLAKEIPKSEHTIEKVQTAAHLVTRAAEHGGPMIFAQMGMLQAIHRRHTREFNPDRKDTHWGRETNDDGMDPQFPVTTRAVLQTCSWMTC
jgi:hypothetical protein